MEMNNEVKKLKWVDLSVLCLLHKYYDCHWLTNTCSWNFCLSYPSKNYPCYKRIHPFSSRVFYCQTHLPYFYSKFYIPSLNRFIKISSQLFRYTFFMAYFRSIEVSVWGDYKLIRTQLSHQLAHIVVDFSDFMCDHYDRLVV